MNVDIRNSIDAWALLYSSIAKTLDQKFGAEGRSVLRRSIRGYAAERGNRRKAELCGNGLSLDLRNLISAGCDFPSDHRTEVEWIKIAPQELFANVAHCPLATLWANEGASDLGCIYCEEFYHAYFKSTLSNRVQVNLTQMMTHERDELCRISLYLRPANLDEAQRNICFEMGETSGEAIEHKPTKHLIRSQWALFYTHCYVNIQNQFGDKGLLAFKEALTGFSDRLAAYILRLRREDACSELVTAIDAEDFLAGIIPLYSCTSDTEVWGDSSTSNSRAFYLSFFERPLLEQL